MKVSGLVTAMPPCGSPAIGKIAAVADKAAVSKKSVRPNPHSLLELAPGLNQIGQVVWLEEIGLGLTLWSGAFEEEVTRLWLRWCVYPEGGTASQRAGQVIPTGAERADAAETNAQRLAERLRSMGIDPGDV
jgi:hypothetical protein